MGTLVAANLPGVLWILPFVILVAAKTAYAALTGVPSLSGMVTNDTVDWGPLGDAGQQGVSIGSPFDISSLLGIGVNASQAAGYFLRVDQDSANTGGWDGNFLSGTHLIATLSGPIKLQFDPPVEAVGFQMNGGIEPASGANGSTGSFVGKIQAFDTNGNSLGSYAEAGTVTVTADGSAMFIGVASDSANISSVLISESDASVNSGEFAIGPLNLYAVLKNPKISSIRLSGRNLVLTVANAQSGATILLSSTSLTLPFNEWTAVATNASGTSTSFSLTVTSAVVPSISQRFFILRSQ